MNSCVKVNWFPQKTSNTNSITILSLTQVSFVKTFSWIKSSLFDYHKHKQACKATQHMKETEVSDRKSMWVFRANKSKNKTNFYENPGEWATAKERTRTTRWWLPQLGAKPTHLIRTNLQKPWNTWKKKTKEKRLAILGVPAATLSPHNHSLTEPEKSTHNRKPQ